MRNIKPIYFMWTKGVQTLEIEAAKDGLVRTLRTVGISNFPIQIHGNWRVGNGPFENLDWYIETARKSPHVAHPGQVHASHVLHLFQEEPWQRETPHYDVLLTDQDLGAIGLNFLIGTAREGLGTIVSTNRFRRLDPKTLKDCISVETAHELGHVFWAANSRRGVDISTGISGSENMLYADHCATDGCIMRQGNSVPVDWITAARETKTKMSGRYFCPKCESDLRNYFI